MSNSLSPIKLVLWYCEDPLDLPTFSAIVGYTNHSLVPIPTITVLFQRPVFTWSSISCTFYIGVKSAILDISSIGNFFLTLFVLFVLLVVGSKKFYLSQLSTLKIRPTVSSENNFFKDGGRIQSGFRNHYLRFLSYGRSCNKVPEKISWQSFRKYSFTQIFGGNVPSRIVLLLVGVVLVSGPVLTTQLMVKGILHCIVL